MSNDSDNLNIISRLIRFFRRAASFFVSGLEANEPTARKVDAGLRQMRGSVKQGLDDFEELNQLKQDIDTLLQEAEAGLQQEEADLEDASAALKTAQTDLEKAQNALNALPANASTSEREAAELAVEDAQAALEDAELTAAAEADQVANAREMLEELRAEVRNSKGDIREMDRILQSTDREVLRGEMRGNRALQMDKTNDIRRRFNAILESRLNLENRQSGMELINQAYEREKREATGINARGTMVRKLLKQRGDTLASTERKNLNPQAKAILDEALKRAGATTSSTPSADEKSSSTNQAGS